MAEILETSKKLLEFLDCDVRVCSTARISHPSTSAKNSRVLKVELQSVADRNILLHSAKYLKDDPTTSAIFIMLWLLPDELSKL